VPDADLEIKPALPIVLKISIQKAIRVLSMNHNMLNSQYYRKFNNIVNIPDYL